MTDGGMETDLIFHRRVELPEFAAFPLLETPEGRRLLVDYYDGYADIARRVSAGLLLESPTWRANPDWGARLSYLPSDLDDVNRVAIAFLQELAARYRESATSIAEVRVSGMIGPRGDGYLATATMTAQQAAAYHRPQIESFADSGVDVVTAYTLTYPQEAIGIAEAARSIGVPVAIGFTVETDGRLPVGTSLAEAIRIVDESAPPAYFLLNCAHPDHIAAGLRASGAGERIAGVRYNASRRSHAELDAAQDLDEGDPADLARSHRRLSAALPGLRIVGGCCGTDSRHVAALWGCP